MIYNHNNTIYDVMTVCYGSSYRDHPYIIYDKHFYNDGMNYVKFSEIIDIHHLACRRNIDQCEKGNKHSHGSDKS